MPYQNTTPSSRRYTGPSARDLADRLPGSRPEGSGFRLRGWCHGHGNVGDSASLAVWDSPKPEGGLNVKCWASCDRRTIIGALEQNTGFRIWDAWEGSGPPWSPGDRLPPPQAAPGGTKPPISASSGPGRQPPRNGGNGRPERTEDRIYTDHGFTGTTRARPGLDQALAAVREGDTLVVPKLDRWARSVPDARAIADRLQERGVKLALGRALYDPSDPMGKMFFNILATFAEFEADLIRLRTREGMAIARARGKLRGKRPKLSDRQ